MSRQPVTGEVVFGVPRLLVGARTCDRCGLERPPWSWWAPMTRPDDETHRPLGEACADCHALP